MSKTKNSNLSGLVELIPSSDEFLNEYVPLHLNRIYNKTGFSGSFGIAVVGVKNALFTDSRYTLQASKELGKNFEILEYSVSSFREYFKKNRSIKNILVNPKIISKNFADKLMQTAEELEIDIHFSFEEMPENPNKNKAFLLDEKYAGLGHKDKIKALCEKITEDALLTTSPDEVCYILNIRGSDIDFNPLLLSNLMLFRNGKAILFTDPKKINFKIEGVKVLDFTEIDSYLSEDISIQLDPSKTPFWYFLNAKHAVERVSPIEMMKAIKNKTEIKGFKKAHEIDGENLSAFLEWIQKNWKGLNEYEAGVKLHEFRAKSKEFMGESFASIIGYGANGAIVHYRAKEKGSKKLSDDNLLLIDSGGHYKFGTTDVTRTIHLGKPTKEQKRDFTLVLKANIALTKTIFPKGMTGGDLDAICRKELWKHGLNYGHGTGHGVGHFLSVHEGPARISRGSNVPLQSGMIMSIEPGLYIPNKYGIRIENLVLIKESKFKDFLEFEVLTQVPIQESLIDFSLLSDEEREWVGEIFSFKV